MIRRALQDRILRAWLELDPEDALSHAEDQVRARWKKSIGQDLFRVWIDLDAEGAKQAFAVASPALVASCFRTVCDHLGQRDPEGTLDFIASRQWVSKGSFDQEYAIKAIYSHWATTNPQAALAHAGSNAKSRKAAYIGWARVAPLAAWESASAEKNPEQEVLIPGNSTLSAIAPYVLSENPELYRDISSAFQSETLRSWIQADFEGVRKLALSLPENSSFRKSLNRAIAKKIANAEPERAIALYQDSEGSTTSSYHNSGLYKQAFLTLNSTNPERARSLLNEIPEPHRPIALGGILTHEFAADPAKAVIRCREFLNDPATREFVLPALDRALSHGHGSGNHDLTQIVAALPELRPKVTGYLLEGWTRVAPEAAAGFLAEEAHRHAQQGTSIYDADKNQDHNITHHSGMTDGIAELTISRPEFTSEWVSTLPPGDFQNNIASALATNWARFDRESAEAWVQALEPGPMQEKAKEALTKPVTVLTFEERR